MQSSDVDRDQVKEGPYKRSAQYTCDRCGYTERRYEDFIGVVDEGPADPYPHQPSLFSE